MHVPTKVPFDDYEEFPLGQCGGISGCLSIGGRGTLRIRIEDDDGQNHKISAPGSIHIPGLPMVLISQQHWDQEVDSNESTTSGGKCVIKWGQHHKYCKTIFYSISSNTPKLRTASGTLQYQV